MAAINRCFVCQREGVLSPFGEEDELLIHPHCVQQWINTLNRESLPLSAYEIEHLNGREPAADVSEADDDEDVEMGDVGDEAAPP